MAPSTGTSTSAVPRSGCLTTRKNGTPRSTKVPTRAARRESLAREREVSAQARVMMKISLKSSDGCTVKGPTWIQRRAPETVRPRTNTESRSPRPTT